jgi:hypothetical protein
MASRIDEVLAGKKENAEKWQAIADVRDAAAKALSLGVDVSYIHQALNEAIGDDEF